MDTLVMMPFIWIVLQNGKRFSSEELNYGTRDQPEIWMQYGKDAQISNSSIDRGHYYSSNKVDRLRERERVRETTNITSAKFSHQRQKLSRGSFSPRHGDEHSLHSGGNHYLWIASETNKRKAQKSIEPSKKVILATRAHSSALLLSLNSAWNQIRFEINIIGITSEVWKYRFWDRNMKLHVLELTRANNLLGGGTALPWGSKICLTERIDATLFDSTWICIMKWNHHVVLPRFLLQLKVPRWSSFEQARGK